MNKQLNMNEAEKIAMNIAIKYLENSNFDRDKVLNADPVFGGGTGLTKDSYSFVLYKAGATPSEALDFVTIDLNRVTQEYTIIPGASPELELYKKSEK